ncbi:MAG: hypothetical protein ACYDAI_04005 [Trichloromonadaceae bacterium]
MYVVLRIPGPERTPSNGRILPFFYTVNGKKRAKKKTATSVAYITKTGKFKGWTARGFCGKSGGEINGEKSTL